MSKLVRYSSLGMLVALGLMTLSLVSPKPIYLVLAMSVGQGVGALALALYLLAIALDLQKAPGAAPSTGGEVVAREVVPSQEPKQAP